MKHPALALSFLLLLTGSIRSFAQESSPAPHRQHAHEKDERRVPYGTEQHASQQVCDKLVWGIAFDYLFDNREYGSMTPDRSETVFGTRLTPSAGFSWGDNCSDSSSFGGVTHRLMAGVELMADFGTGRIGSYSPVLYYHYSRYRSNNLDLYAGIFSRANLEGDYPEAFFSDKYLFYNNLVQGLYLRYGSPASHSYVEAVLDWHGKIDGVRREKFMLISSGRLNILNVYADRNPIREHDRINNLHIGYDFSMHHYSASEAVRGVMDNILFYPHAGWSWRQRTGYGPLAIDLKAGWLQSFQRDRLGGEGFRLPGGFQGKASVRWRGFGISESIYLGEGIMTYYDASDSSGVPYGGNLYFGSPFYDTDSGIYSRLELFWERHLGRRTDLRLSSVHHWDGARWGWQQVLRITLNY